MFYVVAREKETGKIGVLDTEDFVVEFHDFSVLKDYVKQGIHIEGLSYGGKTWDIVINNGIYPPKLMSKIHKAAKSFDDSSAESNMKFLRTYFSRIQKSGGNLLDMANDLTVEDLVQLLM